VRVPTDNEPDTAVTDDGPNVDDRSAPDGTSAVGPAGDLAATGHGVVDRARGDLQSGRSWKARDRLAGHVASNRDAEALDLLGQVHYDMGDLPAAGAVWFGTTRRGADVDEAVAAWRERHGDNFDQMWRSIPRSLRGEPRTPKLEALRSKAIEQDRRQGRADRGSGQASRQLQPDTDAEGGVDAATVIAWVLAAAFVVCGIVGLVEILKWMVPG
jgi:hypothetical protein